MVLRNLKRLAAGLAVVAALCVAPAAARAETIILVEENGGSFSQSYTLSSLPASFSTGNFNDVKITVNTSSGSTPKLGHSISTTLNATPGTNFDTSKTLTVTVTDDGFLNANPGGNGMFTGNVSNTSAFVTGSVTGTTSLSSPATNLGPTTATVGNSQPFTAASPTGIAGQFALQQILVLRVDTLRNSSATFTGSISTQVEVDPAAAPVPAPGGLVLALVGLPLLGLRRLRKKAA